MMKKKVCIVFLGNIAHDSRSLKMFKSLRDAGYESYVICSYEPGEKKFEDPCVFYVKLRKWKRAFLKIIQFYLGSLPLVFKINSDVVIASDLFSLPPAWLISIKSKANLVYDSRELYSALASLSKRNLAQKFWSKFERYFALNSKLIITVNQSISDFLSKKFPNKKIIVLRNLPEFKNPGGFYQVEIDPSDVLLVYLGNFHPGRGFNYYFELLKRLTAEMIDARLLIIGKGELKEKIEKEIKSGGIAEKTFILGPYSPDQIIVFPNATKIIGLCIIEPLSLSYIYSLPNKIFEYIRHKIPFVVSDFPEIRRIVSEYKVGILVDPQNPDDLYRGVKNLIEDDFLYDQLKRNCETALRELNWENEIKKLYEALESL